MNIGHGRREMAKCIAEQARRMQYYNPFGHSGNEPAAMLSAKLAELTPDGLNHVFFTTGGSTANDAAIRLVHYCNNLRGKPRKKWIISRLGAYHGATYVAASLTGIHATKYMVSTALQVTGSITFQRQTCTACPPVRNCSTNRSIASSWFRNFAIELPNSSADNVAAFIAEPIMGAGGVLVAPRGYHRKMREICRENDVLYIADEVVTGFGRLGAWFASEDVYDYVPDVLVLAKGINSGYVPLGRGDFLRGNLRRHQPAEL